MTTIAALYDPVIGAVIGSDRMFSNSHKMIGAHKWVEINEGFWVGVSGVARVLILLAEHKDDLSEHTSSAFKFANAMSAMFREYGFMPDTEESSAPAYDCSLIVASYSGVYSLDCTMTPFKMPAHRLVAHGSGGQFAMGAGQALGSRCEPVRRVTMAIEAGCDLDAFSGGKPWVRVVGKKNSPARDK